MHIIYKDSNTHGNLIYTDFNINFAVTEIAANRSLTKKKNEFAINLTVITIMTPKLDKLDLMATEL